MRIARVQLIMPLRPQWHRAPFGVMVSMVGMLVGCEALGGNGISWVPADIGEQVVVFIQDFARQALAAWLF